MIKLRRLRFAINFIEMVTREVNFDERKAFHIKREVNFDESKPCHINTNASSLEESVCLLFSKYFVLFWFGLLFL